MSNVLTQLGISGTPEGDFQSALSLEGTGLSEGTSTTDSHVESEYTALGVSGFSCSSPSFVYYAIVDTASGLSQGTVVVDGQGSALLHTVGLAEGTSTAEASGGIPEFLTSLGTGAFPQTYPLHYVADSSGEGTGSAYGTSLVEGSADIPIIEDTGTPDSVLLGSLVISATGTIGQLTLTVNPTGGLSFSGTAPRLRGFTYQAVGGVALRGTVSALKSRTINPSGTMYRFSGTGGGGTNVIKHYTHSATGGYVFAGTGSVDFFKNFGPGATGKIRDKRRITYSTRAYSRG